MTFDVTLAREQAKLASSAYVSDTLTHCLVLQLRRACDRIEELESQLAIANVELATWPHFTVLETP